MAMKLTLGPGVATLYARGDAIRVNGDLFVVRRVVSPSELEVEPAGILLRAWTAVRAMGRKVRGVLRPRRRR